MEIRTNNGFTLIELLVVLAIVGMLSSTVLSTVNVARTKANGAQTISTAEQYNKAFDLYFSDNGHYPIPNGLTDSTVPNPCLDTANCQTKNGLPYLTSQDSAITDSLYPYINPLPKFMNTPVDIKTIGTDGKTTLTTYYGANYFCNHLPCDTSNTVLMNWAVSSGQKCGVGATQVFNPLTGNYTCTKLLK